MKRFMSGLSRPVRWLIGIGLFILCGMAASSPPPWGLYCGNVLAVILVIFLVLVRIYKPSDGTDGSDSPGQAGLFYRLLDRWEDLDEVLSTQNYIVLDTETTGLDPSADQIVQIALITVADGEPVSTFSSFVNPRRPMPEEATKINHITDADLAGAPTAKNLAGKVLSMIDGQTVIAHNAKFDIEFLERWARAAGKSVYVNCIDTILLARKAFPAVGSYALQHLIRVLGIESADAHRADADTLATQQLFERCKEELRLQQQKAERYAQDRAVKHTEIKPTVDVIDTSHPLYRKVIVFTGYMEMPREEAMQAAVNCGAILRGKVTTRTDYLVCGEEMSTRFGPSKKVAQAVELYKSAEGHAKIITEQAFYDLIRPKNLQI